MRAGAEEDKREGGTKTTTSSPGSPPALFSLDRQADGTGIRSLEMPRHPAVPPPRSRGRPPRKKRGPKPRLIDDSRGDGLPQLPLAPRLSDPAPVRRSCFSESSEEEDEEDEDDERSKR